TLLGFGAAAVVGPELIAASNHAGNSAAPLLAQVLGGGTGTVGGQVLFALVSAVAFATILAVVAGLALGASAHLSHALYTPVLRRGQVNEQREVTVAKPRALALRPHANRLA